MLSLHNMHSRAKSRSCDNYLSIKDSESLDSCIQSTLSALYPPFSATAATVLWQLFSVVERQYRGDGLRCLIDFLLPAKRILQTIQQETCVRFKGLLFYHEGWPLCIHEKVVLQLAPLHKVRLKQGDFYLQVVPLGRKSAKLVIKCLSGSGQAIAEIPVEESMYGSVFTADFLQNVTRDRNLHPLQNCLLTTGAVVYRTPWKNIVNPLFVTSTADAIMQARRGGAFRAQLTTCSTSGSTGTLDSHRSSRESLHSQGADSAVFEPATPREQGTVRKEPGATEDSLVPTVGHQAPGPDSKALSTEVSSPSSAVTEEGGGLKERMGGGPRALSFSTDLSNPGLRRRHPRDSAAFEARRLFRKSYMEALQNPMNLGSSSESILEEATEQGAPVPPREDGPLLTGNSSDTRTPLRDLLPRRIGTKALLGGEETRSNTPLLPLQRGLKIPDLSRSERRSKSLERTSKTSQVKGHRARSSSGGSASGSPKKSLNGYSLRFGRLEVEAELTSTERKEDSGLHEAGNVTDHRRNSHGGDETQSPKPPRSPSAVPPTDCALQLPRLASEVNQDLLGSGAIVLPGNRDRSGRAVLQVCTRSQVWAGESCTAKELTCLLGYYYTTLRKEKQDQGITVLVDTRKQQPSPVLFASLSEVQALLPNALYCVLMLVDKDTASKPERDFTVQCELLPSLKALLKHIDSSQLTRDLEGSFHYDHTHWVQFRRKIEPFANSCSMAVASLQNSIATLSTRGNLDSSKEVSEAIEQQRRLMKDVLDDTRLIRLRLEGGTVLARIRKEEPSENDSYRDAVDMVSSLYNQVDEEVHKLVILSNKSLKQLENLLEIRRFEEGSERIKLWFSMEGENHLAPLDSLSLSLSVLRQRRQSFTQFLEESLQHQKQGLLLIRESKAVPNSSLLDFKQYLSSILGRIERRKSELEVLLNLYEFYDSADQWAEHCQDYLRQLNLESDGGIGLPPAVLQVLQDYQGEAAKFSPENFHTLNEMVLNLGSSRELEQWNALWHRCQQARGQLEEALCRAKTAPPSPTDFKTPEPPANEQGQTVVQPAREGFVSPAGLDTRAAPAFEYEDVKPHSAGPFSKGHPSFPSSSSLFPFPPEGDKLSHSPSLYDDTDSDCTIDSSASCQSEPVYSPATRHRKQPLKKIMKKTMSYDLSTRDTAHTHAHEVSLHGYTGVYIKGLEVANNVSVEKKLQRPDVKSPALGRSRSMSSPPRMHCRHSEGDSKKQSSKVKHIMEEMIATEREYVRSLGYIIENYFPEMERLDLPQDLRGKRSIIFGNVEKLYDFHSHYFLKELESSAHSPLSISSCFLRHEDQFGMYALYSKNKPQSDALLASHGNGFFKNKQVELGDKMDLASYLLKPIQRMSKYALLLKDLIKECGHSHEQELSDLRTAEEMVKFQLRHGNDLLAMDAIRGCDVNLKEQGQLRCQDEFIVWCGRRKYLRHVFLFEDLILFSKTKKIDGGYDIYIYKQSYKTAEIGMTENVGDSGLRFEIWFRRRKSQDTFILQASSGEVKAAWTTIIGKILWRQALRNRELRMQEMVSMGIGNKPFMDIKPSEAAISDRAIDYIMKGSESRTRASIAVSSFDHSTPFKRPHSTISNSSTSSSSSQSSSSLLGSLNLHLYPSPAHPLPGCPPFGHWPYDCIEEDELEQDTSSQPSMITESSETSSQCTSSDSVTGLNGLTLPGQGNIAMETYSSDATSFLCASSSSSSPPQVSSSAHFQKEQDLQQQSNKFITASKTSHITLGLSTVV
ncbi:pleckstrin homology domain-containing family G member 4B isoform X1 [Megalops cyprinoides]|uniref:pleckstrin homology domain-containing family G member 4B isoform X1 n=1 Tax=Megalops cyprinoides TaxID=118141 RepID=UPI001864CD64|nr:pleckstrin homology domain-containing family G member 4B isoform X1 [Megalops cyprinoides]